MSCMSPRTVPMQTRPALLRSPEESRGLELVGSRVHGSGCDQHLRHEGPAALKSSPSSCMPSTSASSMLCAELCSSAESGGQRAPEHVWRRPRRSASAILPSVPSPVSAVLTEVSAAWAAVGRGAVRRAMGCTGRVEVNLAVPRGDFRVNRGVHLRIDCAGQAVGDAG